MTGDFEIVPRTDIRVVLNGRLENTSAAPNLTLLDWLRGNKKLTGTKEGCAEGDCGACTVLVEQRGSDGSIERKPINACITLLGQVDGLGIRTIEGLARNGDVPHPAQTAFAEEYATQCGFCTPGFVLVAYSFALGAAAGQAADEDALHNALAGNLCRCTGYRPILRAVRRLAPLHGDPLQQAEPELAAVLQRAERPAGVCFDAHNAHFWSPRSLAELAALRAQYPEAVLLAGGTDLGLFASQARRPPATIIHVGRVAELNSVTDEVGRLVIGAAVSFSHALAPLAAAFPGCRRFLTRIGSWQIRNAGTIGGNLGTASPIGDMLPLLLALGAEIHLYSAARGRRIVASDDFFQGYRQTALSPDEFIEAVSILKLETGEGCFADKISKRRDQDISTLCAAYRFKIDNAKIQTARIAYGGMAAMPKRAFAAEAVLRGQPLSEAAFAAAAATLAQDFTPIGDWRGSADYRSAVAGNLLRRLYGQLVTPALSEEKAG